MSDETRFLHTKLAHVKAERIGKDGLEIEHIEIIPHLGCRVVLMIDGEPNYLDGLDLEIVDIHEWEKRNKGASK